ncbi:helix-turn-helix domain-containing protein [Massilia sp. H6]|uniref:winged helix-turn-helix domain-containing protein n=1 Tax=Massilia sp. H6 TaxID=2970464 RepID=UPI00216922A7|nr:helix-turn-helix domain-containing protein [Massilia sp. H6]UVW29407.1 helix-turn-helix domain-containing protein [Massilia sp. H6]
MQDEYWQVDDPALIEALASPIRQEIVDTLGALGVPVSAAELSLQLGRHVDGLYYHLKLLAKSGLVVESMADQDEARRYALPGAGTLALRLAYRTDTEPGKHALRKFARAMLKVAQQDFDDGLDMPEVVTSGSARQLWAARNKAWLSKDELAEANTLLQRLCDLMSQPRTPERTQLLSCAFVLAPHLARTKRRGSDGSTDGG